MGRTGNITPGGAPEIGLSGDALHERLLREGDAHRRLGRLWRYYRNPEVGRDNAGRVRVAQEEGLPARLRTAALPDDRSPAPEVVIENDIGWRIDAMVDFMLGGPVTLLSMAAQEERRRAIGRVLDVAFEASGGAALLHEWLLTGAVSGVGDLLVRADALFDDRTGDALAGARRVRIEVVAPERATAILDPNDWRRLLAYAVCAEREAGAGEREPVVELWTASRHRVWVGGRPVRDAVNALGVVPVVHVQNRRQPLRYRGVSDVEGLIPLQDELNTRMSDRAHRVTMQSFRMYLAKGVEGFGSGGVRIGPGQVWSTDNLEASVEAFGGDARSPSEDAHVEQIRQALDKASSVTPVAAGVIRERIGQLSSENALRITFTGLLARTARKQQAYGRGLQDAAALVLRALAISGHFATTDDERQVRVEWPEPLPLSERERLEAALKKTELGVSREQILAELGYGPGDPGIV
ncbi:MAG: phage portal protein [Phycisphaerales bacterium]